MSNTGCPADIDEINFKKLIEAYKSKGLMDEDGNWLHHLSYITYVKTSGELAIGAEYTKLTNILPGTSYQVCLVDGKVELLLLGSNHQPMVVGEFATIEELQERYDESSLSFIVSCTEDGEIAVPKEYTRLLCLKPGDIFEIKLGRRVLRLVASDASR